MMKVTKDRFADYFKAVHDNEPFPWQKRLVEQVVCEGAWPTMLKLPTGAGKTAILDVSLFALACGIRTPRRTMLVVDRRIVVDDAYRRAVRIRDALDAPEDVILRDLRDALLGLGGATPLEVALLRGGIYREENWARDVLQPVLACSTVDQVGSRLLHQGYGVSPHARPIHAGLLGNDCLIVLDEAHASEPFRQTLEWIAKYREQAEDPLDTPFATVTMTATPRGEERPFTLNDDDRKHPVLRRRIEATKNLTCVLAEKPKDSGLIEQVVKETFCRLAPGETVLVVVNRVKTARAVAEALRKRKQARKDLLAMEDPILLTGRSRPLERDRLLAPHRVPAADRLFAGRDRGAFAAAPPFVIVATQCVEVGADFDVDLLVSEVCPLDSLRQRLGRLDRLGVRGESDVVVVAPREIESAKWEDPVYGSTPEKLWRWLSKRTPSSNESPPLNVGTSGWDSLLATMDADCLCDLTPEPLDAPVLFPGYLDLWVQTSPVPAVLPEPALFLHGPRRGVPEVQIVWRADLPEDDPATWGEIVSECPPVAGEALSVPIYQARQWLDGDAKLAADGSDIEGEPVVDPKHDRPIPASSMPFLRWQGRDTGLVCRHSDALRPGDTLVVPCSAGGCDAWGWIPASRSTVVDLADEARYRGNRAPIVRLSGAMPETLKKVFDSISAEPSEDNLANIDGQVIDLLKTLDPNAVREAYWRAALAALKSDAEQPRRGIQVLPHPSGAGWILRGRRRMAGQPVELAAEDDSASRLGRPVALRAHAVAITREATRIARMLVPSRAASLRLAAELHDLGKADPRFQAMLHGGNRFRASHGELLAKSEKMPLSLRESEDVRSRAGYPRGGRHELLSVRLAEAFLRTTDAPPADRDLVLHLIASHHGRCRPFAPVVQDPAPRQVSVTWTDVPVSAPSDTRVDGMGLEHVASGVAERFWSLVRKHGWWGLSYLEACLRLADWRVSAREEQTNPTEAGGAA